MSNINHTKEQNKKRNLIIIDDDTVFLKRLALSMEKRNFSVNIAENLEQLRTILLERTALNFAIVDLKLAQENGLEAVQIIRDKFPNCRIIVLTAFGNIASAVSAIKAGAIDYLAKPINAQTIEDTLLSNNKTPLPEPPEKPMSVDRVKWEHIWRVYEQCGHNVSETARRLSMHRRTLQRILAKHAPSQIDNDEN